MRPAPGLRGRTAIELAILGLGAGLLLGLAPVRPPWVDPALALGAAGLVAASARETRARFWGAPAEPWGSRARRAVRFLLPVTLAGLVVCAVWAAGPGRRPARLLAPDSLVAFGLFLPWAWLQEFLVQFYLLGRMRVLCAGRGDLAPVGLTALAFGAVHLPDWRLALLAAALGAVWSEAYRRHRVLLPVAASHAALGTAYFTWVRGHDLLRLLRPGA